MGNGNGRRNGPRKERSAGSGKPGRDVQAAPRGIGTGINTSAWHTQRAMHNTTHNATRNAEC